MKPDVETVIREILRREMRVPEGTVESLNRETPLLGRGVGFDSMEVLTLATAVESAFGIRIADGELTTELFRSYGDFVAFVEGRVDESKGGAG
jgi:acyl carrier protein